MTLVLDSVSSPITKRVYNMALSEFMAWFRQAPRPGFTKATVSAWRVSPEERRLGSSTFAAGASLCRQLKGGPLDIIAASRAREDPQLRPRVATSVKPG